MPKEEVRCWLHEQNGVENEDNYIDNSKSKDAFSEEMFIKWVRRMRGRKPEPRRRWPEFPVPSERVRGSGRQGSLCAPLAGGPALWGPAGIPALRSLPGLSRPSAGAGARAACRPPVPRAARLSPPLTAALRRSLYTMFSLTSSYECHLVHEAAKPVKRGPTPAFSPEPRTRWTPQWRSVPGKTWH